MWGRRAALITICSLNWIFTSFDLFVFNASTGADRDGYETCVGPHGSVTVNQKSTRFLDFTRSHGLWVAGSCFQC